MVIVEVMDDELAKSLVDVVTHASHVTYCVRTSRKLDITSNYEIYE